MNKALTAQRLARELLAQAAKLEPQITADLKNTAENVSAEQTVCLFKITGIECRYPNLEIKKYTDE